MLYLSSPLSEFALALSENSRLLDAYAGTRLNTTQREQKWIQKKNLSALSL